MSSSENNGELLRACKVTNNIMFLVPQISARDNEEEEESLSSDRNYFSDEETSSVAGWVCLVNIFIIEIVNKPVEKSI